MKTKLTAIETKTVTAAVLGTPPTEPERSVCSAEACGCASPYEKLKLSYLEKQLTICDQMLTEQGVPEWVARRKDVDQQLQDMMEESLKLARARHNGAGERPAKENL